MLQKAIEVLPVILDEMYDAHRAELKEKVAEMNRQVNEFLGPVAVCCYASHTTCNHVLCEVTRLDNLFNLLLNNRWYLLECPGVCRWARKYLNILKIENWYTRQATEFKRTIFGETN